jgi:hypothetical protein
MKKRCSKSSPLIGYIFCIFWACIIFGASPAFAQQPEENLLDKVELNFELFGDPDPGEAGFNDPKSYWKVEYELMLTDFAELVKIGRCRQLENLHLYCPLSNDKKMVKKIRKLSIALARGQFVKTGLAAEESRDIKIPVDLSAEAIEIYNRAETGVNNPTFVLYIKTRAKTKNAAGAKFKKSTWTTHIRPLKFYNQDKTFGFWNVRSIGVSFGIVRTDDGKLAGFRFFRL